MKTPSNCVAIVDWRLIKYLHATLSNKSIPWILLDRSPPADKGLLAKLQWPIWKKSWRLVGKTSHSRGSVVSPSHGKFVQDFVSISDKKIFTLPAVSDLEKFTPGKTGKINLIYHGQIRPVSEEYLLYQCWYPKQGQKASWYVNTDWRWRLCKSIALNC